MKELIKAALITIFGVSFIIVCTIAIYKPVVWLWIIGSIMLIVNGLVLWRMFRSYKDDK